MTLELIQAQLKVSMLEVKLHAAKQVVAFLQGDAPVVTPTPVKEATKPANKKAGTQKRDAVKAELADATSELAAKKTAATKSVEAAAAKAAADKQSDKPQPMTFKEGKINVFGDGRLELRHLTPEERAPYTMGVLLELKREEVLAHGVMAVDLVKECWDNMSEAPPSGMPAAAQEALKATPAWGTMPVPKELLNHMITRVDEATFKAHVFKLIKALSK